MDRFHFFLVVLEMVGKRSREELWHSQGGGQIGKSRKSPKVLRELSSKLETILICVDDRLEKLGMAVHACVLCSVL